MAERNDWADVFAVEYERAYGMPYIFKQADFVQLANLRRGLGPKLTMDKWTQGVMHYFASENVGIHTLAYLCSNFVPFWKGRLDRYGHRTEGLSKRNYPSRAWHNSFLIKCFEATDGHPEDIDKVDALMDEVGCGLISTEEEANARLKQALKK